MTEAIQLLKKWHDERTTVTVPGVAYDADGPKIFESRVRVRSVNEDRLVLSTVEGEAQTRSLDLNGVRLSVHDGTGVELMCADGKNIFITEP